MPKTDTIILLGKAVKCARNEMGLTQKEVAKKPILTKEPF